MLYIWIFLLLQKYKFTFKLPENFALQKLRVRSSKLCTIEIYLYCSASIFFLIFGLYFLFPASRFDFIQLEIWPDDSEWCIHIFSPSCSHPWSHDWGILFPQGCFCRLLSRGKTSYYSTECYHHLVLLLIFLLKYFIWHN